jgi:hypothetical protein
VIDRILKTEPVRLYSIAMAAVALAAYFVPTDAWPLILGLIAAVLGTGQAVRSQVFSQDTHERTVWQGQVFSSKLPTPDTEPTTGAPDQGAADFVGVLVAVLVILAIIVCLRYLGVL